MFLELCKLRLLKAVRSVTLGRKLIGGIVMAILGLFLILNVLALGLGMKTFIQKGLGHQNVVAFINRCLFFFFLGEIMYRFLLQKVSALELENYLHLPIGRPKIIHFLLISSFVSPFNIIGLMLFAPLAVTDISAVYGWSAATGWLLTIVGLSWSLHWFMIWFKQNYGEQVLGVLSIFVLLFGSIGLAANGIFNVGSFAEPFFSMALINPLIWLASMGMLLAAYFLAYGYYRRHAYLEELDKKKERKWTSNSLTIFNRFGLAGEIANLELKLILRHKRSRFFLGMSLLILFYGLIFYTDDDLGTSISFISIFVGVFITGSFIMNYGRFFLSWNSPHFDFFLSQKNGARALIRGKHMLICGVTTLCFLLSIPYVYFGWKVLLVHLVTFLFNIGINIHVVLYLALWKPQPISLDKSGMFNYEGMGAAQFLMGIPLILLPYLVYLLFSFLLRPASGLLAVGLTGVMGLIFYKRLTQMQVNKLLNDKYEVAASFRREL